MTGEIWVTKVDGKGVSRIELLEETIDLDDKEIYVVMWYKRFLPMFMGSGRPYDIDYILYCILGGNVKPGWEPLRFLSSCFFT